MTVRNAVLMGALAVFGVYSAWVVLEYGYLGLWLEALRNPATGQVLFDLVVALALVCAWMIGDARRQGRRVWPYLVATLFLGSFGPLFYLLLGRRRLEAHGA